MSLLPFFENTTNQSSGIEISLFVILIGAILYYFGRIISETKVEKFEKVDFYVQGLFFGLIYVFIPSLLGYYFRNKFKIPTIGSFVIQILILSLLSSNFNANYYLRQHGLLNKLEKTGHKKYNEIKNVLTDKELARGEFLFKSKFGMSPKEFISKSNFLLRYKIPIVMVGNKWTLLFFSFITLLSSFQLYNSEKIIAFMFSLILTFFILTFIASAYGYSRSYYPPAKIYMSNGEIIEGKILKFSNFVYVLKGDKNIFINKDNITRIEESLFKEVEDFRENRDLEN